MGEVDGGRTTSGASRQNWVRNPIALFVFNGMSLNLWDIPLAWVDYWVGPGAGPFLRRTVVMWFLSCQKKNPSIFEIFFGENSKISKI